MIEKLKVKMNKENTIKKINEQNNKTVHEFINLFVNLNNREPMESEIIDNLKDKIEVHKIKKIIEDNRVNTFKISNAISDKFHLKDSMV
jgi:hypothetical protein